MNEKEELLEKIKIENWIWILYLFLIGFSFVNACHFVIWSNITNIITVIAEMI